MQIERLVQMVFYIASHGHVTAKELSDHFQVSTRTGITFNCLILDRRNVLISSFILQYPIMYQA